MAGGPRPPDGTPVQALLRASELEVEPADSGVDARVLYHEFRGEFMQYGVRLPSGAVVRVRRRSADARGEGAHVAIRARPRSRVIVFTGP